MSWIKSKKKVTRKKISENIWVKFETDVYDQIIGSQIVLETKTLLTQEDIVKFYCSPIEQLQ